ncbi:rhomboid family intramembrane serine protease [Kordia sp.]|uniref:rhomboid family intramembrane serine protease n=1 Tax=Kordia sp. TaxID=1965332 RepID=UPI003B5B3841
MDTKTRLLTMYRGFNVAEKLIAINITIFAIISIYDAIFYSFSGGVHATFFSNYFALQNGWTPVLYKPWTIVSCAFLHASFGHLLSNCIVLYFSGRIFLTFFTEKQFITVYAYGILAGSIFFLLAYNLLPTFKNIDATAVGASAAVLAILVAGATYAPNYVVNLFGVFQIKYWIIAVLLVISYISYIPLGNAGGQYAHIGGALIGFMYARQLTKGNDIGIGFERFWDRLNDFFTPKKKSPLKTVYKNKTKKRSTTTTSVKSASEKQQKVDAILDKISKSGYESLTKAEKDFLFKAGKEN